MGIFINHKKTQIVKLSHGFTWLKTRYILTTSGKIIRKIPRKSVTRERRTMKRMAILAKNHEIEWNDLKEQYKSWRGDKKKYNAYHTLQSLDNLYKELMKNGKEKEKCQILK